MGSTTAAVTVWAQTQQEMTVAPMHRTDPSPTLGQAFSPHSPSPIPGRLMVTQQLPFCFGGLTVEEKNMVHIMLESEHSEC